MPVRDRENGSTGVLEATTGILCETSRNAMSNGDPPKVGVCYCGCGGRTGGHWVPGHDARGLRDVIEAVYGGTAAFLAQHDAELGEDRSTVAKDRYGSIAAFVAHHGYGPENRLK